MQSGPEGQYRSLTPDEMARRQAMGVTAYPAHYFAQASGYVPGYGQANAPSTIHGVRCEPDGTLLVKRRRYNAQWEFYWQTL